MAGLPYDLMKRELIEYLNLEYPDGGTTVDKLRSFRVSGPRRDNITDNRLYTLKTQLESTYGCNQVSRKALRSIASQSFDEGLLIGYHPNKDIDYDVWYEADQVSGSGSSIVIPNQGSAGSGWNLDTVTGTNITPSTYNGNPSISFGGGGSYIDTSSGQTINTDFSIVSVFQTTSTAYFAVWADKNNFYKSFADNRSSYFNFGWYSSPGQTTSKLPVAISTTEVYCVIQEYDRSTGKIYQTGGGLGWVDNASAHPDISSFSMLRLGARATGDHNWVGNLHALGMKRRLLTKSEKDSIFRWANYKYGAKTFIDPATDLSATALYLPSSITESGSETHWTNLGSGGSSWDLSTLRSGGSWSDISKVTGVNGNASLDFSGGANNGLETAATQTLSGNVAITAVFNQHDISGYTPVYSDPSGTSDSDVCLYYYHVGNDRLGPMMNNFMVSLDTSMNTSEVYCGTGRFNTGSTDHSRAGGYGSVSANIGTRQMNGLMLGNKTYADTPFNGQLYALVVWDIYSDAALTDLEIWSSYEFGSKI